MSWNFKNPVEIHFGFQFPNDLSKHIEKLPTLYVTSTGSTKRGLSSQSIQVFKDLGIEFKTLESSTSNPSFIDLEAALNSLEGFRPQQVIALGGGSVVDLAKMLSYVLAPKAPPLSEVFRILYSGKSPDALAPLPFVAISTTSGTGSEVTPFATLWDSVNKKKYSLGNSQLFPKKALLDPRLTLSLPWDQTLATGMDAFSQALESVWNKNHTPITGALAARAVKLSWEALPQLKQNLHNLEARTQMQEASLLAGICISKTRTALAHSASYPLTAHFGTPHGLACSFTLPELWDHNFSADRGSMAELSKTLGVTPQDFSGKIRRFMSDLGFKDEFKKTIPGPEAVLGLCGEMYTPGRADNNLKDFSPQDLRSVIETSLSHWI